MSIYVHHIERYPVIENVYNVIDFHSSLLYLLKSVLVCHISTGGNRPNYIRLIPASHSAQYVKEGVGGAPDSLGFPYRALVAQ